MSIKSWSKIEQGLDGEWYIYEFWSKDTMNTTECVACGKRYGPREQIGPCRYQNVSNQVIYCRNALRVRCEGMSCACNFSPDAKCGVSTMASIQASQSKTDVQIALNKLLPVIQEPAKLNPERQGRCDCDWMTVLKEGCKKHV